ncbi:LysR family transcriptional regulator [Rhizobium sp. BK109]|uniref:LysR family transcriptional regulator n=1 Tax=unclassified Rhizobium TaxID=2613769 RepID=UPI00391812F1
MSCPAAERRQLVIHPGRRRWLNGIDAAKALELDHSTSSCRLSKLEEGLCVQLFERAGRRLRITSAGDELRRSANLSRF